MITITLVACSLLLVGFFDAPVGHGGASGYIAILTASAHREDVYAANRYITNKIKH